MPFKSLLLDTLNNPRLQQRRLLRKSGWVSKSSFHLNLDVNRKTYVKTNRFELKRKNFTDKKFND